jgi:hypothetical protein
MDTIGVVTGILGIIIGIIATVVVARYYYRRSVLKSLGVYKLLHSQVFAGIEPDVREQLHFHFGTTEVKELQQLTFLIANDGERAIGQPIEPLTLPLPEDIELLDASILHRQPASLRVSVSLVTGEKAAHVTDVTFDFPLLNRGDFFVAKLLLSGPAPKKPFTFRLLAEDLDRTFQFKRLPLEALEEKGPAFVWMPVVLGGALLSVCGWFFYILYVIHAAQPEIFPYPWRTFSFSARSLVVLLPSVTLGVLFLLIGLLVTFTMAFEGVFPPHRGPRFPLPAKLRPFVFAHGRRHSSLAFDPAEFDPEFGPFEDSPPLLPQGTPAKK